MVIGDVFGVSLKKILSVSKKVVLLHPLSKEKKGVLAQ